LKNVSKFLEDSIFMADYRMKYWRNFGCRNIMMCFKIVLALQKIMFPKYFCLRIWCRLWARNFCIALFTHFFNRIINTAWFLLAASLVGSEVNEFRAMKWSFFSSMLSFAAFVFVNIMKYALLFFVVNNTTVIYN